MVQVEKDFHRFHFADALDAFVFDEGDQTKLNCHGAKMMTKVDILGNFEHFELYLEIKEYYNDEDTECEIVHKGQRDTPADQFRFHKNVLKYKFRDTLLYRYVAGKVHKPIKYFVLAYLKTPELHRIEELLNHELPVNIPDLMQELKNKPPSNRPLWNQPLVNECKVLNFEKWNKYYPQWRVEKV